MIRIKDLIPSKVQERLFIIKKKLTDTTIGLHLAKKITKDSIVVDTSKSKKEKFLMLLFFDPKTMGNTVVEQIQELIKLTEYRIDCVDLFPGIALDRDFKFLHYDGIIFHSTITEINYRFNYRIDSIDIACKQKISDFKGLKIFFRYDEWLYQYKFTDYLCYMDFDLIVTLCDADKIDIFYPPDKLPKLSFIHQLTSYVKESYLDLPGRLNRNRSIDAGYRGSPYGPKYGRLLYDKEQIGIDFKRHTTNKKLNTDISSEWRDRIYGDKWLEFLCSCKSVLGTESGVSIVDIDGTIEADLDLFLKSNPKASDEDILAHLSKYENKLTYKAIAPRHFEAAACLTLQIMYEDNFQGIFKAGEHYVVLNRDYSNIDEVIEKIFDDKGRRRITENAFSDIVQNEEYSFKKFVSRFDCAIDILYSRSEKERVIFG